MRTCLLVQTGAKLLLGQGTCVLVRLSCIVRVLQRHRMQKAGKDFPSRMKPEVRGGEHRRTDRATSGVLWS
jgi:hypothetical protein